MSQELLKSIYLFSDFGSRELSELATIVEEDTYQSGDEIFSQGDKASALYVIKFGSVKVLEKAKESSDPVQVATLGTGSHFGEMGFLDTVPRSASVEALEKSQILRIEYDKLKEFLDKTPTNAVTFYRSVARFLSGRLRSTTLDLSFVREFSKKHL
jgi:CRP/FNR family cyclic AMP-dependent transcriptional regulator